MRVPEPILTAGLFDPIHDALIDVLRSLTPSEWQAPTAAGQWSVKDVTAHLLDTALRRLSMHRDGFEPLLPQEAFANGIGAFVNNANRRGVEYFRALSPDLLIDLHIRYGSQLIAFMTSLDPLADAKWSVTWAGEDRSPMWFDVAREMTERWHHQQQIRDATGRPPLYDFLAPVIATFVRAMPFTYRDCHAPDATAIVLRVTGEIEESWSLVRQGSQWMLYEGEHPSPATVVTMTGDRAWRLFTRQHIDPQARTEGEKRYAEPLLKMVSVV